jgi:manganese/zinc/iron transport system substrate-binding protein
MIADLVANLGGPHVAVEALMGEGTDPHLYKASPGDVKKLSGADIIFYNGLHLEGKMVEIFERLAQSQPTFAVSAGIPKENLRSPPEFQGQHDPHIWFDVSLWAQAADYVRDVLIRFDPPRAESYRSQGETYLARLKELHAEVTRELASIPEDRRILITAHDAFGYFGRAYGIQVLGIQGISTDSEAGVRRMRELVELILAKRVKSVFVESSVSERSIQALVEGCKAQGHGVTIGGQLFSDAMGKAGTPEGTYLGMVRHNVKTIVQALR